ncbi:MAG: metallopeptidase TldD-related protein [Niabella sp.]
MIKATHALLLISTVLFSVNADAQDQLSKILKHELQREFAQLKAADKNVYYMSYRVDDIMSYRVNSSFGVINAIDSSRMRIFTPTIRVGSYQFDNTHNIQFGANAGSLPVVDNEDLIRLAVWKSTDGAYKNAVQLYEQLLTNKKVRVAEEDTAADFSTAPREIYFDAPVNYASLKPDLQKIAEAMKAYTAVFKQNPDLLTGGANFEFKITRKYFVDTDGSDIVQNATEAWQSIYGNSKADDGMELPLYKLYFAYNPAELPAVDSVLADVKVMSTKLSQLRKSPLADPFVGPAILSGRAAGVFFHEIFGHRLEGKRMKNEFDGQTFKNKIGTEVLPGFLSITMDPTRKNVSGNEVNGFYKFDDEGVAAQKVDVVENGILKNFLMTRTPINGVSGSNGHARTAPGGIPESRQSNLIVTGKSDQSFDDLRALLIAECKKQGKPYGYLFQDVQGGFTNVGRTTPNAFNVLPTEVYKIYADGKPDELVRGVDLIGTPLSMFKHIAACSNQAETFNGMCGSGSGWVPVSVSSPAIFVDVIETQKKSKSSERMPVLPRPDLDKEAGR